ncbi:Hhe domain protein [Favolaschia claudopus]|uniref:Hhe domain protein n=1 Tax=Favolaschia claudopus TaxID=2862362 RepID=A0AAW0CTK5_9AGAR
MATKQTLTQAIKEDHEEMYEYHENYRKFAGDADSQARWANQLRWEIARHAVGEELVVYPLMEKHLGAQGLKLADHDREEHQHVKEMLYKMESMTPGSAEYDKILERMMASLHEHNDSEEVNDLPLLEPHLGEGSQQVASQFSLTKKFAPTRAHPSAPNKPPFETFAGFLAAPIDKLRDAFTKFPTNETKEAAES